MKALEILDRLIGFSTVSADSNLALIDYVQDHLKTRGFETHRMVDKTGLKAGLFASIGPSNKAGVMLSGHTDVVPVTQQNWTTDPFRMAVQNGRAYGRGTTDMEGYLASVLAMADRASRVDLKEPLKLAFSYDEEIGCVGIKSMIHELEGLIGLPRCCFVGEPTSMQVAVGHKGKVAMRATCHGVTGHSAVAPGFLNALHLACDFVSGLRDLQADYAQNGVQDRGYGVPYSTLHVGKMSGGVALNIVPDEAVVDFELRHLATESAADIYARISAVADEITSARQGQFSAARIDVRKRNAYPALETDAGSDVVEYARKLAQSGGVTKVDFGTEAGYFSHHLGVPTIVCGPGSMAGQGHMPDEYIELGQLAASDAMLDRLLGDMAV